MLHLLKSGGEGGGLGPFFLNFLDLPLERVAMLGRLVRVQREDDDGGKGVSMMRVEKVERVARVARVFRVQEW